MGWIPTVRLFKDGRTIKVNANNTLIYAREGWSRKDPNEPTSKREMTPDEESAEAIVQEKLLENTGSTEAKPELENPNLADLQVD